jgi:hypothetical protein
MKDEIYTYTGQGAFVIGLPARDIKLSELTEEQRDLLRVHLAQPQPIYVLATPAKNAGKGDN